MQIDQARIFRPSPTSSGWRRPPATASRSMVATSHPLATLAGMRALERGGNAVDAALAAATVLTVSEPMTNGIGGDAFAIVWNGALHGLNGSGRSPGTLDDTKVASSGPRSVTVPGAVRAWADLAERFGSRGLDAAVAPAVELAEGGLACSARIADIWRSAAERAPWPAPGLGGRYALPELARTLRRVADDGPDALYGGDVAAAIASATWLSEGDLVQHRSEWVEPLRRPYRGIEVCELPPNGQGAAALIALGIYEGLPPGLHSRLEATKLALADAYAHIADGPLPAGLLADEHLAERRGLVRQDRALDPAPSALPRGGTTYLCAVDEQGLAVSLIQSLYESFGSGVVAPGTGVLLHNRAAGFVETDGHPNRLAPSKRPFHTIIPGMLLERGDLLGPFGVMGGFMQPQGHVQLVLGLVDDGLDPQAALDAPRWRVGAGREVLLEPGLWKEEARLRELGHEVRRAGSRHPFGVGQAIIRVGGSLVGGSDSRADGFAAGI